MKIKVKKKSYEAVCALPVPQHKKPKRPSLLFRTLLRVVSTPDLFATHFICRRHGMERCGKREPCLYLMNHSSFLDLKIAASVLYPRPFQIVCTSDGFIGKAWLMRQLGCIPTNKFVTDLTLVRDLLYTVRTLKSSILLYPEASYSFDGTATTLPDSLGQLLKKLKVPVIMLKTHGAFLRDPLYNGLRLRKVSVSADMTYLLSPEDIENTSVEQLNAILREQFSFDAFKEQRENHIAVTEPFRAEGLNRVLYRCPHCGTEGKMTASGSAVTCTACGKAWTLLENGTMQALSGETEFSHIPDWYAWERACVRGELENGSYRLDVPVIIRMMVDTRAVYEVGEGWLHHDRNGFHLTGCGGKLDYFQKPLASYSLYADYYWYELGDMICIGDQDALYYCFPTAGGDVAAKTRLAAEELYQLVKQEKQEARGTEVSV